MTDLNKHRFMIESAISKGNRLIETCSHDKCTSLASAIKTLSHKYKRCQYLASKRKEKLAHYSQNILEFDRDKQIFLKMTLELEMLSMNKMSPSKLTAVCAEQIKLIKVDMLYLVLCEVLIFKFPRSVFRGQTDVMICLRA